jgi:hypothetical protein
MSGTETPFGLKLAFPSIGATCKIPRKYTEEGHQFLYYPQNKELISTWMTKYKKQLSLSWAKA